MLFKKTLLALWICNLLVGLAHADGLSIPSSKPLSVKKNSSSTVENVTLKLDLNQASVSELTQIPGISAHKAKAIVAFRKKHGNFQSVSELAKVKGFKRMSTDSLDALAKHLIITPTG